MASRRFEDLQPEVAAAAREHVLACADRGIDLLIYCTLRDAREQADLYARGRTTKQIRDLRESLRDDGFAQLADLLSRLRGKPGPKLTGAGPGESSHQYGLAYDCVPMVQGKTVWRTTGDSARVWDTVGRLGKRAGLEWGAEWSRFREFPHFERMGGRTIDELMQGRYGESVTPSALPGPPPPSESDALRTALDEATTKFLVLATVDPDDESEILDVFRTAETVRTLNPNWRLFWVRDPGGLDDDLKLQLAGSDTIHVGAVLSLGQGLGRQVKHFELNQLDSSGKVFLAYSWSPLS